MLNDLNIIVHNQRGEDRYFICSIVWRFDFVQLPKVTDKISTYLPDILFKQMKRRSFGIMSTDTNRLYKSECYIICLQKKRF